jgi:CAAX prenyl protease-like protein
MNAPTVLLANFPAIARVAPFVVFLVLTFCQGYFGEGGRYWLYLAKTLLGAWMLWMVRSVVREMRWKLSWEAVAAGVAVFVVWVGLDQIVPTQQELWIKLGLSQAPATPAPAWNPFAQFGHGAELAWFFVYVRFLGSALIVPPLEEVFYRSFLYRWIARPDFASVPLGLFAWKPFLLTAFIFGFAHNEWLAGILCAAAYQGLVCWKKRLGDAITAHAITNLLLGIWVAWRGAWHFW